MVMAPPTGSWNSANGAPLNAGPPLPTGSQLLQVLPAADCHAVYTLPSELVPNTVIAPPGAASTTGAPTNPVPLLIGTNDPQLAPGDGCHDVYTRPSVPVTKTVIAPPAVSWTRANGVPVNAGPPLPTGTQPLHEPPAADCHDVYSRPSTPTTNAVIAPSDPLRTDGAPATPRTMPLYRYGDIG